MPQTEQNSCYYNTSGGILFDILLLQSILLYIAIQQIFERKFHFCTPF